uniref:SMODS domain-containing nucleotidyltransferase n=1 Tax=Ndongobacter massiliensis TaxID=1871025 RepID=UPI000931A789|nr:nucleotidyltransferase domain-containing protein [Ndongobacter massiliensis]
MSYTVTKSAGVIPQETRSLISRRYKSITSAINRDFWSITSDTSNSFYVGSYGRNTAISTSDIDILTVLPNSDFDSYNNLKGNAQSRLLQAVRNAILSSYPRSDIRADGQVVKIAFSDGMYFEILPAFQNKDWFGNWSSTYTYPNSNMGGNWKSTNPKAEQEAIAQKNRNSNGLLVDTCRHLRVVRDTCFKSYHLSGIVIDTFVYDAIEGWHWLELGEESTPNIISYEQVLMNYFNDNLTYISELRAPGSGDSVSLDKSKECLGKVLRFIV